MEEEKKQEVQEACRRLKEEWRKQAEVEREKEMQALKEQMEVVESFKKHPTTTFLSRAFYSG